MTSFVEAGLGNALVALVLAVVALIVGLVCRRPAVAHALWLLVLLKFVTPPLMSVSLPWPDDVPEVREESQFTVTLEEVPSEVVEEPPVAWKEDLPTREAVVEPVEELAPPEIPVPGTSWQTVFGLVWLTGSLIWFLIAVRRLWRFGRLLRHARPASKELTSRVAVLAKQLGLRDPPRILLVQGHLSPMVWAFGRVALLIPSKLVSKLSATALDTLLAHELAHIRRRDHWVRWLELVALALYWWNPVVWLARRELRQAEELCCDAWVVRCLPDARRVYATALVDALDFLSRPDEPVPALGCGLGKVDDLKWRLTMILRGQTSPRLGWTTTLGVFALALTLPLVPGFSRAQESPKSKATPDIKELDPKIQAEIEALIEKRIAEARAKMALSDIVLNERNFDAFHKATPERKKLDALLASIAKKEAELRQLKANVEALRGSILQYENQKVPSSRGAGQELRFEGTTNRRPGVTIHTEGTRNSGRGVTIRIEAPGEMSAEDLKIVMAKINEALGDKAKIHLRISPDGAKLQVEGTRQPRVAPMRPPAETVPEIPRAVVPPPKADRRIDALEKKLNAVLKELEALRKSKAAPSRNNPTNGLGDMSGWPPAPGTQ